MENTRASRLERKPSMAANRNHGLTLTGKEMQIVREAAARFYAMETSDLAKNAAEVKVNGAAVPSSATKAAEGYEGAEKPTGA